MIGELLLCHQKVENLHIARLPVFVKCLFCACLAHKDNPTMETKCKLPETVSGDCQLHKYCLLLFLWSSPLVLLSWVIPGRPLRVPLECDRDGIRDDCFHLGLSSDFLVHGPQWREKIVRLRQTTVCWWRKKERWGTEWGVHQSADFPRHQESHSQQRLRGDTCQRSPGGQ